MIRDSKSAQGRPAASLLRFLTDGSMTLLLVLLVATVFVLPVIAPGGGGGELLHDISLTLVLFAGAAAVVRKGAISAVAVTVCLLAIVLRWAEWVVPGTVSLMARQAAALLALVAIIAIVAMRVFAGGSVSADRIMGAVALYLLLGFAWAAGYDALAMHVPNAFSRAVTEDTGPARFMYFSLVTLTTVGYGDITPLARAARSLAAVEALVGQLYPAIILARLVSLHAK